MMYHHHILTLDESETVKKMYIKQKETNSKGDWYDLLLKDFQFIGEDLNEQDIKDMPKYVYKKKVKSLVEKVALKYF